MSTITKLQPLIIIISALGGLFLGNFTAFGEYSASLIEIFLMILLYFVFLSIDLKEIKSAMKNIKFTAAAVLINFAWTPVFAFILGWLFLRNSIDMRIGFLMLMVTPCTDWYLVFTALAKGNVELGTSILPLNLILQILLLPVYIFLFFGGQFGVKTSSIIMSIILVLIIPFLGGMVTKALIKNREKAASILNNQGDNFQLLFLCLAIISMFASESQSLLNHPDIFLRMLFPVVIFFTVNYFVGQFTAKKLKYNYEDRAALNMTTLARNSPLSLAVAATAFPDRPLISLALIIGPLIELPALAVITNILLKSKNKEQLRLSGKV